MQEKQFVKECMDNLVKENPQILKKDNIIHDDMIKIPPEMSGENASWRLVETTVSEEQLKELEEEFNITFPTIYKAFLSTYCHAFERLWGIFDDYYDEDNVTVGVDIFPQLPDNPLRYIQNVFRQCESLLQCGYIPIGDLRGYGPLCIDTQDKDKIVWFDHEEYFDCETRESFEELAMLIFDNFTQFLECFFCGKRHSVGN